MYYSGYGSGYGYGAFGVTVPTPLPGQPGFAPDMNGTGYNYCGSKYGFQQMLQDLGYYKGPIDGVVGTGSLAAARAFSSASGVPLGGSGGMSNQFCDALIAAWQTKMAPRPAPAPAPAPAPSPTSPPQAAPMTTNGGQQPPSGGQVVTTNGGVGPIEKAKNWWASASTGTKVAIGIGGVALVGIVLYTLVGGKKQPVSAPAMIANWFRPNRRRILNKRRAVRAKVRARAARRGHARRRARNINKAAKRLASTAR